MSAKNNFNFCRDDLVSVLRSVGANVPEDDNELPAFSQEEQQAVVAAALAAGDAEAVERHILQILHERGYFKVSNDVKACISMVAAQGATHADIHTGKFPQRYALTINPTMDFPPFGSSWAENLESAPAKYGPQLLFTLRTEGCEVERFERGCLFGATLQNGCLSLRHGRTLSFHRTTSTQIK